jgi:heat shock protein HtpX
LNLLEQQDANRRRTMVVIVCFVLFLGIVGAGIDFFLLGGGQRYYPIATTAAVLIGSGSAWVTYFVGDRAILASSHAEPLAEALGAAATDADRLRYTQFQNVVAEVAIAAGLPPPRAYVIPDRDPNAFATGRDPAHASIAVTEGLLQQLNREELQGVVAHEMGHVRNLDIRLLMIISALVGAVVLLADWSTRSMMFGSRRDRDSKVSGPAMLVVLAIWIVAVIVAPVVARLMAMAVSRQREYLADASGAELTRNPLALASALRKIDAASAPTEAIKRGSAALCIADPTGSDGDASGRWCGLWATHPPIAKRIAALDAMAYQGEPAA